jgi:hypothetical protein
VAVKKLTLEKIKPLLKQPTKIGGGATENASSTHQKNSAHGTMLGISNFISREPKATIYTARHV